MQSTNVIDQEKQTQAKKQKCITRHEKKKQKRQRTKAPIRRIFPIWLRLIVIFLLTVFALILGMVVGYTMLGDGTDPLEVLTFDFWKRVLDIINGVE